MIFRHEKWIVMTEANALSKSTFGVMVCHVWVIAFREIKTEDEMLKAKPNKAMTGEFWQFKEGRRPRQAEKGLERLLPRLPRNPHVIMKFAGFVWLKTEIHVPGTKCARKTASGCFPVAATCFDRVSSRYTRWKVVRQNFLRFHVVKVWIMAPIRHFHTDRKPDESSSENFQILFIFVISMASGESPCATFWHSAKSWTYEHARESAKFCDKNDECTWQLRVSTSTVVGWSFPSTSASLECPRHPSSELFESDESTPQGDDFQGKWTRHTVRLAYF